MTLFGILAAAITAAVVAALWWPMRAASRGQGNGGSPGEAASNVRVLRDQLAELDAERRAGTLDAAQHAAARAELERRVLDEAAVAPPAAAPSTATPSRATALVLAVALPLLALGAYWKLGNRMAFDPVLAKPPSEATPGDIETLVQRLAARMQAEPGDPVGWALLGRAYTGLQRFEAARDAYAKAVALVPAGAEGRADLLADYADALAMAQGGRLAGEPERVVRQALADEPDNLKALALAGTAALERGDARTAVGFWTRARRLAPSDSPFAAGLDASLAEARARAGMAPAASVSAAADAAAPGAEAVRVRVTIRPDLAPEVRDGDVLFVVARAADAQGAAIAGQPPVAVWRGGAAALRDGAGVDVVLDDSQAMAPAFRLSRADRIVVSARVSRTGDAATRAGDLLSENAALVGRRPEAVELSISTRRP